MRRCRWRRGRSKESKDTWMCENALTSREISKDGGSSNESTEERKGEEEAGNESRINNKSVAA